MQDSLSPGLPGEKPSFAYIVFPVLFMSILNTTLLLKYLFTRCSSSFDGRRWGHAAAHSKARRIILVY